MFPMQLLQVLYPAVKLIRSTVALNSLEEQVYLVHSAREIKCTHKILPFVTVSVSFTVPHEDRDH